MANYRIVYEDPDFPDDAAAVVVPSEEWLSSAMSGKVPPIWVHWQLQDDEKKATDEGWKEKFCHDEQKLSLQETLTINPLTEEQAMEYLALMVVPRRVWAEKHNRPMMRICKTEDVPSDRVFRMAWTVN